MARIIVLDAGPLGLASKPPGKPDVRRCLSWIVSLWVPDVRVVIPEIADYEVRRELIRVGANAGIARLEHLAGVLDYEPITTQAMRLAAHFWASARQGGIPTADRHALDADCILAAQASCLGGPNDVVTIATTNVRHLGRFSGVDAREWDKIAP